MQTIIPVLVSSNISSSAIQSSHYGSFMRNAEITEGRYNSQEFSLHPAVPQLLVYTYNHNCLTGKPFTCWSSISRML